MGFNEKDIELVNQTRVSTILLDNLRPILDQVTTATLDKMKQEYRGGDPNHMLLLSSVATLCALDDIVNALKARINQGRSLTEEIYNGRTS